MKSGLEKLPVVLIPYHTAGIYKKIFAIKRNIVALFIMAFIFSACNRDWQYLKSAHFNIRSRSDISPDKVKKLDKVLEDNYARVSQFLKTVPDSLIQVNIYSHQWQYDLATGNYNDVGSVEGTSNLHFILQAWDEKEIGNIAVREFTHAVTLKLLMDQEPKPFDLQKFRKKLATMPVWLTEGVGVYESNEFIDPKTVSFLKTDTAINLKELNSRQIHQVAYTLTEYIMQKYGHDKLVELLVNYGNIPKVLGVTNEQFTKDWYAFVKQKYLV